MCGIAVSCGGKSGGDDDSAGQAGGAGRAGAGASGASSGGAAGRGGSGGSGGTRGGSGGEGNAGAEAGAPSAGTGSGGSAGAGAGGGAGTGGMEGGSGGGATVPTEYATPGMGQAWRLESGDPLNSTPPVLVSLDSGVVIAGASADPATVGVTAFDSGIESEAFVARLDATGMPLWQLPLKPAGLPWAMARSGDDVVIVAPYLPDLATVSTSYVSKDIYLAKVGIDGNVRYEKTLTFDNDDTFTYGLAVDEAGSIFLAGGYQVVDPVTGFGEHPILVKVDPDGNLVWQKTFTHAGTQGYANDVAVLADGDLVMTGDFDLDLSFGGDTETLTSSATLMGLPSGFLARFTSDGEPVWSAAFGGDDFSVGTALAPLADGDFLLTGGAALDLHLGGKTVPGAPFTPSSSSSFPPTAAFVARLDGDGAARWVNLELETDFGQLVACDDGATVFLGGSLDAEIPTDGGTYLLTYDAATGDPVQTLRASGGAGISSSALAVGSGKIWLSGRFTSSADFGNQNLLTDTGAGVFLVRLDASP